MKKGEKNQPQHESGGNKSDPHEVLNDGIHYVVTRVTAKNKERVLTAPDVPLRYTFFSQISAQPGGSDSINFFGQGRRHLELEDALQKTLNLGKVLCRGQLITDKSGFYNIASFTELSEYRHFSKFSKKQLRRFLLEIFELIDPAVLADRVIVQLNANSVYLYLPKHKMLRPMRGGKIGSFRY